MIKYLSNPIFIEGLMLLAYSYAQLFCAVLFLFTRTDSLKTSHFG